MSETNESMGEYFAEGDLLDQVYFELIREKQKKGPVWVSKDGTVWLISQMKNDHLLNAIRWLERRAGQLKDREVMALEIGASTLRGEMAIYSLEREARHLDQRVSDLEYLQGREDYSAMRKEADRRGLALLDPLVLKHI
jgi:hypothetical protein